MKDSYVEISDSPAHHCLWKRLVQSQIQIIQTRHPGVGRKVFVNTTESERFFRLFWKFIPMFLVAVHMFVDFYECLIFFIYFFLLQKRLFNITSYGDKLFYNSEWAVHSILLKFRNHVKSDTECKVFENVCLTHF